MELSPEERRRIYEEEKARIEADARAKTEPPAPVVNRFGDPLEPPPKTPYKGGNRSIILAVVLLVGTLVVFGIAGLSSQPQSPPITVKTPKPITNHYKEALAFGAQRDFDGALKHLYLIGPKHKDYPAAQKKIAEYKGKLAAIATEKKRKEAAKLAAKKAALAKMDKKHDEVQGLTWYSDRSSPKYVNSRSNIHLYAGHKSGQDPWFRFVIQYTADDWLFIQKYTIKADDKTFTIAPPPYGNESVNRDNGGGDIWEWYDVNAEPSHLAIAVAVAESKRAVIRHEGRQYYKDRVVTQAEKQAIKNVIKAVEAM